MERPPPPSSLEFEHLTDDRIVPSMASSDPTAAFRRRQAARPPPKNNPFGNDDDSSQSSDSDSSPPQQPPHRSSSTSSTPTAAAPHDPQLSRYERLLSTKVDRDLFSPPSEFHALSRVIDILGASLTSHANFSSVSSASYSDNDAYRSLAEQRRIVEEAIEHMAVRHCADLNLSVSAVGRMSRQFDEAAWRVGSLRRQVGEVGDSLRLGEV